MKHQISASALGVGIVLAGTLAAQPPVPPGPLTFSELDRNGDGSITEQEFTDARAERMAERARQGYGMRNIGKAPSFATIDADGNGRVTPDELAAAQQRHRRQGMPQP